ncbi:hypothetical protein ACJJTC_005664 [Scirpophaga incertulas]
MSSPVTDSKVNNGCIGNVGEAIEDNVFILTVDVCQRCWLWWCNSLEAGGGRVAVECSAAARGARSTGCAGGGAAAGRGVMAAALRRRRDGGGYSRATLRRARAPAAAAAAHCRCRPCPTPPPRPPPPARPHARPMDTTAAKAEYHFGKSHSSIAAAADTKNRSIHVLFLLVTTE